MRIQEERRWWSSVEQTLDRLLLGIPSRLLLVWVLFIFFSLYLSYSFRLESRLIFSLFFFFLSIFFFFTLNFCFVLILFQVFLLSLQGPRINNSLQLDATSRVRMSRLLASLLREPVRNISGKSTLRACRRYWLRHRLENQQSHL